MVVEEAAEKEDGEAEEDAEEDREGVVQSGTNKSVLLTGGGVSFLPPPPPLSDWHPQCRTVGSGVLVASLPSVPLLPMDLFCGCQSGRATAL